MMKRLICVFAAVVALLGLRCALAEPGVYNWYEVFVRSYQDSDGDGIGDLPGLISRLDYIQDMGYEGLWLMPVMPSPSYHKYDVTDYRAIDPEYGDLEDMRRLVQDMHDRGMRLIIDLPINHTSTLHPWFLAAKEALSSDIVDDDNHQNYYHFNRNGDGVPLGDTGFYYEESFAGGNMPDLALEYPDVVTEIRSILEFWLTDVGVDGFRLDAVTSYFTGDVDANVAFLSTLHEMCQRIKPGCYLVGECWAGLSTIARYYDSGVDSFFLFPASQAEGFIASSLRGRGSTHAEKFAKAYQNVLDAIPNGTLAPFLSNHDTGRTIGSVQGRSNQPAAKFAEGVLNMLQGCVFTYYGEEIGMVGSGDDPNKRLAMYWSDGDMTAQPPGVTNLEYAYPSVEAQQADPDSLLNYCRAVTNARRQVPAIARGTNEFVDVAGEVCLMRRTWEGESVLIALNFSAKDAKRCDLPSPAAVLFDLETGGDAAALEGETLTLPPYAIVILREGQTDGAGEENEYYVRRVDGLPEDFFMGMDVSSVLALEKSGVMYRDAAGNERDLFELLAENGVNLIRVRVWNDPFDSQGRGYGGGNCDIKAAVEIGKRATAAGMRLLVDFHYSDFWADPSKQMIPKAWVNVSSRQKAGVVREWTEGCLQQLRDAGVDVAMVQLGNETNGRLCGEASWTNIVKVMRAGGQAVREIFPDALIAVHFANPENANHYRTWAQKLSDLQLDYDVFGTSYYPWWHGTLDNLKSILSEIGQTYGKRVMVLETSYAWTLEDGDFSGNTISAGGFYEKPYPIGVQGQINQVADVIAAMRDIGGIGVCYWEGAWVPVGRSSWAENAAKWEAYGSGWASSFAGEYDPEDAGKYYGGSACDNQTMFDFDGRALPSLAVFRLVRTGQNAPLRVDALDDVVVECDLNGAIVLPQNVYAVMNDNSRRAVPVAWESIDEAALRAAGPGQYEVHGEAGGRDATLLLRLVRFNFLRNGGFEEDDLSMWRCVNLGDTSQLYCEEKKTDSLSGLRHWHFYDEAASSVCFELEQDAANLPAGRYDFAISVMGGDAGDQEIYSYVKINGETRYTQPTQITSWSNWFTPEIKGIAVETGDTVTVGIHVRCDGAGAWGKIDDAALTSAGD